LVENNGELGLVVTPPCDLPSFSKKTGRRLTLLKAVRLDQPGLTALRALGLKLDQFGNSIVAGHGGAPIVLLPSVPLARGDRTALADYAVLCHAWENHTFPQAPTGEITYAHLPNVIRRCTLTEPFASAMVARVASVISSPGTPDLPKGELARLNQLLAAQPPAAVATNPPQQPQP